MPDPSHPPQNTSPCPAWCARLHTPNDHPEDRYHRSSVSVIPGASGEGHPIEIIVYAASDDSTSAPRLVIEESERPRRLTLSWSTAAEVLAGAMTTLRIVDDATYGQANGTNE